MKETTEELWAIYYDGKPLRPQRRYSWQRKRGQNAYRSLSAAKGALTQIADCDRSIDKSKVEFVRYVLQYRVRLGNEPESFEILGLD